MIVFRWDETRINFTPQKPINRTRYIGVLLSRTHCYGTFRMPLAHSTQHTQHTAHSTLTQTSQFPLV